MCSVIKHTGQVAQYRGGDRLWSVTFKYHRMVWGRRTWFPCPRVWSVCAARAAHTNGRGRLIAGCGVRPCEHAAEEARPPTGLRQSGRRNLCSRGEGGCRHGGYNRGAVRHGCRRGRGVGYCHGSCRWPLAQQ
jgi:hypothetical protein